MEQVTDLFSQIVNFLITFLVVLIFTVLGSIILKKAIDIFLFQKLIKDRKLNDNKTFLLIKIPSSNEQKETAMDEFLKSLHRVLPNNSYLSLEMVSSDQFLSFYIATSKNLKNIVESQLYAQYQDAEIVETEDYITDLNQNAAFEELTFKKSSIYPISTYQNINEDLLKSMSAILAKTDPEEKVYLQLALKRVGSKFWDRNFEAFRFKFFGKKYNGENSSIAQVKTSHDLYMGKLRVVYVAKDKITASLKLKAFIGLFKSLKGKDNEFKRRKYIFGYNIADAFKARVFESGNLWTSTEIATIYHFSYKGNTISNVVNTTSKRAPAPDILPREGLVDFKELSIIGETNFRNDKKRFGVKRFDRRRHLYVIGKTGSGKSKLLELLLLSDIQDGEGCCLLDPHGDLAEEILKFVPKERIKDVVYINPIDRDFPIGFNPLEPVDDYQMRQHISTFFIAIFKKLLSFNWNPRMEHVMRYITLALLETPDSNVLGIQRILSDANFRQRVIKQIQDPVVKNFWLNDFKASDQSFINEAVLPIINKIGQFTSNSVVRNMIGQRKNMLNFEKFMNEGKIVIISISKGKLGDENSALLGSMFITKIQQAALERANISEEKRKDFYFYVDEFQNFATDAFSTILSEARKYRLDLTIAHQYMAQLPDEVKATAFGNVGSIISFAVGGDDASYLAKEFAPTFTAEDLINLNTREMYIKMSVDGRLTTPFSARTINVPTPQFNYTREIIDHSRMTFGKNRAAVENEIATWSSSENFVMTSAGDKESFPEPII